MGASASELETLRREAGRDGDRLRFRQGEGPVVDASKLVDGIRTDQPIELVEPMATPLAWSANIARLWACDCAEHVVSSAAAAVDDESYVATLEGAIHNAREFVAGALRVGTLDAVFAELMAEEWPTTKRPFGRLVRAVRQATARDEIATSWPGEGIVRAGEWAATAAAEAREATPDVAAERRWQLARLLDYLLLGAPTGPAT